MNGPRYGKAYPPWERAPGKDTSAEQRIIWLETAIGVFLLNTDKETQDLAALQADKVLERLTRLAEQTRHWQVTQ